MRINVGVPFPSLVMGSGPVTISKTNGIWTVGFSIDALGHQAPLIGALPTDYLIVYDSVAKIFFKASITDLRTATTTTVANLPAANANQGVRYMVTNANATAFWSIVAAGGANVVPVTSDGVNWRIG
jgi:hypothetical protein